jgi:hypothetical protein
MDGSQGRLALIEVLERDGRVRRGFLVTRWPASLGRALDNDLVIDDPHAAAHHARIAAADDGSLRLEVGATRNGVQVGPRTVLEGESVPLPPLGEVWQIGGTRLRVRLPGDPLEPERPLGLAATGASPWLTAASALALWALVLTEHAIYLDPGSSLTDWLMPLFAWPVGLLLWCVFWGAASKLFQHRFEFWAHFSVAAKGLLLIGLLDLLLPVVAFALSWEWLSRIAPVLIALVAGAVLYRHAALAIPVRRRWLAGGIAGVLCIGAAVMATLNYQRSDDIFPDLYLSTLPPPGFRLAAGVSVKEFVAEAAELRARLDQRAADDRAKDKD